MRYKDKVVVVTGGSKGIGFGCVRAFVEEGGADVVFCARNAEEGEAVAAHLNARGPGRAHFIQCDVSKVDEVRALIDTPSRSTAASTASSTTPAGTPATNRSTTSASRTSATCST